MSSGEATSRLSVPTRVTILLVATACWISPVMAQLPGHSYRLELKDAPKHYLTVGGDGGIVRWADNNNDKRQSFVFDRDGAKYRIKTIQTSRFENRYLAIQSDGYLRTERFESAAKRQQFTFERHGEYFALVESTKGEYVDVAGITGWLGRWAGKDGKPKSNQLFKLVDESRISQVNNPPSDWMRGLNDARSLASISIPGTHDSGAKNGSEFVRCQNGSIADQLAMGVRFLDIRVRAMKRDGGALDIYHGSIDVGLKFEDVLDECKAFLQAHPTETIIMRMAEEHDAEGNESASTILDGIITAEHPLFFESSTLPTLGQARGHIVLMSDTGGRSVRSNGLYHSNSATVSLEDAPPGGGNSWTLYGVGATGIPVFLNYKWNRIKDSNTNELQKLRFTYISGTGVGQGGLFPSTIAAYMNSAVFRKMQKPSFSGHFRYGLIVADFAPSGIIDHLIHSNFQP